MSAFFLYSCEEGEQKTNSLLENHKEQKQFSFRLNEKIKKNSFTDSLSKVNKNFMNLINNFEDSIYTIELLRDKTKQNMSYIHPLTLRRKQSILDTPAVKSRLVLTHLHIRKLNYLINKKNIQKDTVEKTLNTIVKDINHLLYVADKYRKKKDEFKEILDYDSILHDSTFQLNHTYKTTSLPQLSHKTHD